jgi:hypothetical protein
LQKCHHAKGKLLGIDIDYQLNFNYHIKNICRKASQQLNVLKRIGCFLSKLNKLTIFHTFILGLKLIWISLHTIEIEPVYQY